MGVGTVNHNRNSIAIGTDPPESSTMYLENLFSHSTPSHLGYSTQSHSEPISLEEINELNKTIGASGGTDFLEEDDLAFINEGVEKGLSRLRSGKTYGLKEKSPIPPSMKKVPSKSPFVQEFEKLSKQKDKGQDDDDNDDEFFSMQGSGQKRSLDELDDYPFPVFKKKWVLVE